MTQPQATQGFSTLSFVLPEHLVREQAARKGIVPPAYANDHNHVTLLYGLPGDTHLQEEVRLRIADLLRWHRVLSVDVTAPVLFVKQDMHTLAFLTQASHLDELRQELLEAFPEACDPYRHGGWVPHVTLAHMEPGTSWKLLTPRRWDPVALPVAAFELHRADGVVEVLTPVGDLTAYR